MLEISWLIIMAINSLHKIMITTYLLLIFGLGNAGDYLTYHNGHKFSTKDQDNDPSPINCAAQPDVQGAWWFDDCRLSNLNGAYSNEEGQGPWLWGGIHPIKRIEMKIRPTDLFKPMD